MILKYLPFLIIGSTITFCYGILGGDFDGNNIKYIYITGFEALLIVTSILSIVYRINSICGGGVFIISWEQYSYVVWLQLRYKRLSTFYSSIC